MPLLELPTGGVNLATLPAINSEDDGTTNKRGRRGSRRNNGLPLISKTKICNDLCLFVPGLER
jgi:hypothetical protein